VFWLIEYFVGKEPEVYKIENDSVQG